MLWKCRFASAFKLEVVCGDDSQFVFRLCSAWLVFACGISNATAQKLTYKTPQAAYERGHYYWNLSLESYNELRKTAPESAYSFALLGEEKAKRGQYPAALEALDQAAKRMPGLRGVHSAISDIYVAESKPAQAYEAEAAEQKLGPPDCSVEKLQCDFSAGRFDVVVGAAKLKPGPEGLYWLARAYRELALQSFAELNNFPESADLHQSKARLLRDQRRYRESAEEWRAALKLSPADRDLQRELATALFFTQDYGGILPELQRLLKGQPGSPNLNFFVGDSLLETGQNQASLPYLENAVRLDPKLLPAHVSLGLCYIRLGNSQKAIPHLKAGLNLDQNGQLHYVLARAYMKTGQPELAKEMMDKYHEIQKSSAAERGSKPLR